MTPSREGEVMVDASAVLALVQNEPGADVVARALPNAAISAVNLAEVVTKLARKTKDTGAVVRKLSLLKLRVHPWDETAALHSATYAHLADAGLSLGDRACLTAADLSGARVLTADRQWLHIGEFAKRVDPIR
jgi:ribonuclease VapC